MSKIINFIYCFILLFFFCSNITFAQNKKVSIIGIEIHKDYCEIKLDNFAKHKFYNGKLPNRVIIEVVDVANNKLKIKSSKPKYLEKFKIKYINNNYYILLDFNKNYKILSKNFDIKKNIIKFNVSVKNTNIIKKQDASEPEFQDLGEFIEKNIIDDSAKKNNKFSENIINEIPNVNDFIVKETPDSKVKYKIKNKNNDKIILKIKKPTIVIDAGHGGKDPGAIGSFVRSKEKNLTLSYAKELAKNLINENKYEVYLTRENDIFIPLGKRVSKSRKKKADLFISLHVNANHDKSVSGFSIYTLSDKSSDKQAEILANKENEADIVHGIDFDDASKDVIKTLIDLSQRESKNRSAEFAKFVIDEIKNSNIEILQNTHRFAGFKVLTAPDMASVLIELGYISNKKEEVMLNSLKYRRKIAKTLALSINNYFKNNKVSYE